MPKAPNGFKNVLLKNEEIDILIENYQTRRDNLNSAAEATPIPEVRVAIQNRFTELNNRLTELSKLTTNAAEAPKPRKPRKAKESAPPAPLPPPAPVQN